MNDQEPSVQEQALNFLRNLASCNDAEASRDIEGIFQGIGEDLIPLLESKLEGPHPETVCQTIFTLVNLATGDERHRIQVMTDSVLTKILHFMDHRNTNIRIGAIWLVVNLTDPKDVGTLGRVRRFREAGFEEKLRGMLEDPELDVKDRAKTALEHFDCERKMEF